MSTTDELLPPVVPVADALVGVPSFLRIQARLLHERAEQLETLADELSARVAR